MIVGCDCLFLTKCCHQPFFIISQRKYSLNRSIVKGLRDIWNIILHRHLHQHILADLTFAGKFKFFCYSTTISVCFYFKLLNFEIPKRTVLNTTMHRVWVFLCHCYLKCYKSLDCKNKDVVTQGYNTRNYQL